VAVLGFMMKPGEWNQTRAFLDAMTNPLYAPQLGFRTFFALMTGAVFLWFATFFFTKKKDAQTPDPRCLREWIVYRLSHVVLVALLGTFLFGTWYWNAVPETMKANSSVALLTQEFMSWHGQFQSLLGWTVIAFLVVGLGGLGSSFMIPRWALLIPSFMGIWLLGHFERAREFMRKPWVIGEYMYSNGIHKDELAFLQSEGLLKHATYARHHEITEANKAEAGQDIFMLACSRCHSTTGLNGVIEKFTAMYGADKPWDSPGMALFIRSMHQTRTFMPPVPSLLMSSRLRPSACAIQFAHTLRSSVVSPSGCRSTLNATVSLLPVRVRNAGANPATALESTDGRATSCMAGTTAKFCRPVNVCSVEPLLRRMPDTSDAPVKIVGVCSACVAP
jgi:hypothetical protein